MDINDSPPPPAYSEQEFDQKISRAEELSQQTTQTPATLDQWEEYDEAAFEAATAAIELETSYQHHGGSSEGSQDRWNSESIDTPQGQSIQPLRIEKKPRLHTGLKKEEPKWLLAANASTSGLGESSGTMSRANASFTIRNGDISDLDGDDLAPPSFAEAFMDRSPYQGVATTGFAGDSSNDPFVSSTVAVDQWSTSHSLSRSISDVRQRNHQPFINQHLQGVYDQPSAKKYPRQSLPAAPSTPRVFTNDRRPQSAITPSTPQRSTSQFASSPGPTLTFNPYMAYGKPTTRRPQTPPQTNQEHLPQAFDASAFYNSAVSAHMSPLSQKTGDNRQSYRSHLPMSPMVNSAQPHSPIQNQHSYSQHPCNQQTYNSAQNIMSMENHSSQTVQSSHLDQSWLAARPTSTYSMNSTYTLHALQPSQLTLASPVPSHVGNNWRMCPNEGFNSPFR